MTRPVIRVTTLLLIATVLLACGARTGSPPPAAQGQQATTDPTELMWRELAEAARRDGKLVIATNNTAMRETVIPAFKQRFGIDVDILTGRGSDTVARIMRERDAGVATIDIVISGMGTVASQLYPAGGVASVKSMMVIPEVTDLSKWRDGRIRFADPDGEYILRSMESIQNNVVINTDVVKRDEVRRTDDLLNPKFRGKISTMDPMGQGGGDGTAGYFLKAKGEEFLKRLYVDQQVIRSQDDRQLTDWLARGVYPITLTMTEEDILQLMRDGMKIEAFWFDDIPPMIGAGGSFLSVMNPTPHPNAAKLWVNWYASKEGQELAAPALGQPSNRVDVEANKKLPPFLIPQPGRDYFDLNDWTFVTVDERPLRARMRELLGG
jgi:ABC-type Fe3+ transport system substrate-binding protein